MELLPQESTKEPIPANTRQNPSDAGCGWKVEKEPRNNPERDPSEHPHNNESQRPSSAAERFRRSTEAQELDSFGSDARQSPKEDSNRLTTGGHLKSVEQVCEELPVADLADADTGLLAEKSFSVAEKLQPQTFSLSTEVSRRDALTERATNSPDIYEVDWHTLEFNSCLTDDTGVTRPLADSLDARFLADNLILEEPVHKQQGSAQSSRRQPYSRWSSDCHIHASPNVSFARVWAGNSRVQKKLSYRACSSHAASSSTTCDQCRISRHTPENAAVRRSASWERVCMPYQEDACEPYCTWLHRGRSVSPDKSASVSRKRLHPESDSLKRIHPSAATRASRILPACRVWAHLPVGHTFSWLTTVNCSGTPLQSEVLQSFAALVCLKHLVLAGCNLKDLNFLAGFAGAVPLQSLIVPFNEIDSLPVPDGTQTCNSSVYSAYESTPSLTSVQTGRRQDLEGATFPAVLQKGLMSTEAKWRRHPHTATARLIEPGLTKVLQCVQGEKINHVGVKQERVLEHADTATKQDKQEEDSDKKYSPAALKRVGKCATGEYEIKVAENTRRETSGGSWQRSTADNVQSSESGVCKTAERENLFPNSLCVVDLSYNCLSDTRQLLLFCSQFHELRTLKVAGNFLHTQSSAVLEQINRTLRSAGMKVELDNQQVKEKKHVPRKGLCNSPLCHCTRLAPLPGNPSVATLSPSCQKLVNVPKLEGKDVYLSATCPSAEGELHHLRKLVKRLEREKAKLAGELEQARKQTSPGGHERSTTCQSKSTVCDREFNLGGLLQPYEETSHTEDRLKCEGAKSHLSPGGGRGEGEQETFYARLTVRKGGITVEANNVNTHARKTHWCEFWIKWFAG